MEIYNVLKKVEQKLANSNDYDLARQKFDSEMGDLALTCFKNKLANIDLSSIKDKILNSVNSANNTLQNTPSAQTLGSGLGGMGIGALLGSHLTPSKSENETDEQYKKRKRESAITGGIAGTALGVSAPSVLNSIKSFSGAEKLNSNIPGIKDTILSMINPTTVTAGAGAVGGGVLNKMLTMANAGEISALAGKLTGNPADDSFFLSKINELKGKVPLIPQIEVPSIKVPFRPTIAQKLLPKLNSLLSSTTRGKLLPVGMAISALLGKSFLDTTAFNKPALE